MFVIGIGCSMENACVESGGWHQDEAARSLSPDETRFVGLFHLGPPGCVENISIRPEGVYWGKEELCDFRGTFSGSWTGRDGGIMLISPRGREVPAWWSSDLEGFVTYGWTIGTGGPWEEEWVPGAVCLECSADGTQSSVACHGPFPDDGGPPHR